MRLSLLVFVFTLQVSGILGLKGTPPVFRNAPIVEEKLRTVQEDQPLGQVIVTVIADEVTNATIKYSLTDITYFIIDQDTGEISMKSPWDYEADFGNWQLIFSIYAIDDENDLAVISNIEVNLENVNDTPPKFNETRRGIPLYENTPVGTVIMNFNVTDADVEANDLLTVECYNSNVENWLPIGLRTCSIFQLTTVNTTSKFWYGYITLMRHLDFETNVSYSIRLIAKDGVDENSKAQDYQVTVMDVNDSPPVFVRAVSVVIPEGRPVGSYIDFVSAKDTDQVDKRPIRYELIGTSRSMERFDVNKIDGSITNKVVLDYDREESPSFTLEVKAMEVLRFNPEEELGDDDKTTAVTSLIITLTDINDLCPEFPILEYNIEVEENRRQNDTILEVSVQDMDTLPEYREFEVNLQGGNGAFKLDQIYQRGSAILFLKVDNSILLDYEKPTKNYILTITAFDRGRRRSECSGSTIVKITLKDVNDIKPEFIKDGLRVEVFEDDPGGTSVTTVKAKDEETGSFGKDGFIFSITGSDRGVNELELFQIDSKTGLVTVKTCATPGKAPCLDYEMKKSHSLFVRVEDNLGNEPTQRKETEIIIYVKDRNDNPPVWEIDDYIGYIDEGTKEPNLTVKATDRDETDIITYTLISSRDASYWTIIPNTGVLRAISNIYMNSTRGGMGQFVFNAQASDGKEAVTATITINVIDTVNEPPRFTDISRTVAISENTTGGTCFTEMTVTDADSPTSGNGQVVISIPSGTFAKFVAGPTTRKDNIGWLAQICTATDATFDYNQREQYILNLSARDKGADAKTGTATLTVNILDTNNKNPYFDPPTQSAEVREDEPIGTFVTQVTAIDRDRDNELVISFGSPIIARNPSGGTISNAALYQDLFVISRGGLVTTKRKLDRDIVSSMEITLVVVDEKANPRQTGTGSLYIRITEYNDQAPQFVLPYYEFRVKEEIPPNSFIGSLLAFDEDDQIAKYELTVNPEDLFNINVQTGVLTVRNRLDYETRHNVTLRANASDTGEPMLSNTTIIFIKIININDNAPEFSQNFYEIDLLEHSRRTNALSSVFATDQDEGDFGVVRYATDDSYFTVNELTGEIFLRPNQDPLDREERPTYTFLVTAYDSPLDASVRLNSSAPVYVILGDINDNCPHFAQEATYYGDIIETADIGDQVLEMFATDEDYGYNRTINFRIDAASAQPPDAINLFSILSIQSDFVESGRIMVKQNMRGKPGTYTFLVVASDQDGENRTGDMCSTVANVIIRVQEAVNDAPIWVLPPTRNFSIDVLESQYRGMLVYDCKAIDKDSGKEGIVDYFFNVEQSLQSTTDDFRINRVTGVISARIVYDREQVSSYVLTVVAKDKGTPSASSETVLIVVVLDVNDNEPEFPMRNGETIPYRFFIPEGDRPDQVGVIGVLSATDKDSDHKNNEVYYRIVAGNNDGMFDLNRESGTLRLSPLAKNGLDREANAVYFMDVLAYNDVNDDTVIRYRRRRSTNPSLVTVSVTVQDSNDTPPKFDNSDYYGCVPQDAPFGQSILRVTAVDQDVGQTRFMTYTKLSETTDDYFMIEATLGIVRNAKLLHDISSSVPILNIEVNDDGDQGNTEETEVQIFVTDTDNEVMLVVNQPSADVRYYKDQLIRAMINTSSSPPIHYVCIREIRDHIGKDGSYSYTSSDVFLSAVTVKDGVYKIFGSNQLYGILRSQLPKYESLHVKSVQVESEEDDLSLTEDPVLAIFIIAILLIFLAIVLFCLACCLIRNSKKKKMKKLRAEEHRPVETVMQQPAPEVGTNVTPVYDNQGFEDGNEYAVVQKHHPEPEAVGPPIVPVMVPVVEADPILEIPDQEPEHTIVTHPIMSEEQPEMLPPPDDFFTPEPEVVTVPPPELEPEPVIETVIMTEVDSDDDDDFEIPEAPRLQTSMDDEIDVEFGDLEDSPSPPRSLSPPTPTAEGEYRIETNIM